MNYAELKIGKLVQTVLKPLIISKASVNEVLLMQDAEWSKTNFGIQYPLLLKTSSTVAEKHYYSDLFVIYGETYRLCCEWFETASNNDRPYVEKWIREHEEKMGQGLCCTEEEPNQFCKSESVWLDNFGCLEKEVEVLPKDGVTIAPGKYKDRTDLTVVEIPDGVRYIGSSAFKNCINLKEIKFPRGVRMIDMHAFENCYSLEKVELPDALCWVGHKAFANCRNLQSVELPIGLREIPSGCFTGCEKLRSMVGSSCIRIIGHKAFAGCKNLKGFSVKQFSGVRIILSGAFAECSNNFVFEIDDRKVVIDEHDGITVKHVIAVDDAVAWKNVTIRTTKGTAGAKMAQELGLKVEYVKDER